jgi:membrane protein required for colicin V production
VGLVGVILKHVFKAVTLGWADRVLGGTFGLVKAILIVSVLLVPLLTFLPQKSPVIRDSLLAPYVSIISEKMVAIVPTEMKKKFGDNVKALREAWKNL